MCIRYLAGAGLQSLEHLQRRQVQTIHVRRHDIEKPELELYGHDGNAYAILARARRVALKNQLDWATIAREAMSGDYDHLLQTMEKYFDVV
jgi:hypothetical protein